MEIVVFINPKQEINEFWEDVITNMGEDDKAAIEFALQLKEKKGGKVTAVAIGGEDADTALREAFAMGVDHACIMKDDTSITDEAKKIYEVLKKTNGDIFVSGRDDEVMSDVSKLLNIPQRKADESLLKSPEIPSLVIAKAEDFNPRYMNIRGVYTAYKREIEEIHI